jgi:uncharacterized protein (DUF433 family)
MAQGYDGCEGWEHLDAPPEGRMNEIAPRIAVDERGRFGRPVIAGTRVPVDLIVGKLAGGMSVEAVAAEYELEREDVLAALAYAEPAS